MNYQALKVKVAKKLAENGTAMKLKRKNEEAYDPDTNSYTSDYTVYSGNGIVSAFDFDKIDGTIIKQSDVLVMASFGVTPTTDDIVEINGRIYQIISVKTVAPDAKTEIYYELQCR